MAKRIVICFDGTWNTPDQREGGKPRPTNVVKMARAVAPISPDGTNQIVFYDQGVGTGNLLDRISGGAFGSGLEKNIEDGYRFLMHNYDAGDEIFLFGFSRGAYTARSLAGFLRNSGLLRTLHACKLPKAYDLYRSREVSPRSDEAKQFRLEYSHEVTIKFVGVWDTVGARGVPVRGLRWITKGRYQFHDVELSGWVKNGYHALAIDERRGPFAASLWESTEKEGQVIEQVWFAGAHSDVGGGRVKHGLSDIAFTWMKEKAEDCGLAFEEDYVKAVTSPCAAGDLQNSMTGLYRLTLGISRKLGTRSNEAVHPAVLVRHGTPDPPYAPGNLVRYLQHPDPKVAEAKGWSQASPPS